MKADGKLCHDLLTKSTTQKLGFDESKDFATWKEELREKFIELTGLREIEANASKDPRFEIEEEVQKDGYKQIRCSFESEVGSSVFFYVLIPDGLKEDEKRPMVITLQGHSTGAHNSVGIELYDEDHEYQETRGKFAVQAVNEGYIAVAIENRGMGERAATSIFDENGKRLRWIQYSEMERCYYEAMTAVLMGRTILGERMFDTKRTIDMMLEHFGKHIDQKKIVITGNSGGGTMSYYAPCYDERITLAVPSCAFCTFPESILHIYHCSCNYIPHAFKWFDMQDLSALIAPRRLVTVNGEVDFIFKVEGVKRGFETIKKIYEKAGAPDNCRSLIHDSGHYWRVDYIWPAIKEELAKMD